MLQSKTVGYSAVATTRSALSSFIIVNGIKVGEHPQIVLNYLKTFPAVESMLLKQLTLKLLMLMALLSAQRIQTLQKLSLDEMCISAGKYTFYISALLKQTSANGGQNRHLFPVKFRSFDLDKRLCVVEFSEAYIKRTAPLRKGTKQLLICYKAPH